MPERFWKQEKAVGEQGKERKFEDKEIPRTDLELLRKLGEYQN